MRVDADIEVTLSLEVPKNTDIHKLNEMIQHALNSFINSKVLKKYRAEIVDTYLTKCDDGGVLP